jgi:diguanylate cyclase (GGDEF)-like protein/PAS domain S-box-containing protein
MTATTPGRAARRPSRGRLLTLFLPAALVTIAASLAILQAESARLRHGVSTAGLERVAIGAATAERAIDQVVRDVLYLAHSQPLLAAIEAAAIDESVTGKEEQIGTRGLATDWVAFSRAKRAYDQIRWLDETGMERVRVDFRPGDPVVVPGFRLQNKGKRYFFTDAVKLNPGEVFISPLDLNIEGNAVEVPWKPMIRVGTPVFDGQGRKRGIVLLNYFGRDLLDRLRVMGGPGLSLTNAEGYWLLGPRPEAEWGFMFKKPELTVAHEHPDAWRRMAGDEAGQFETDAGLWTFRTIRPLVQGQHTSTGSNEAFAPSRSELESSAYAWKLIDFLPRDTYGQPIAQLQWRVGGIALLVLALLLGGAVRLERAQRGEQSALDELEAVNRELEKRVADRTRELEEEVVERRLAEENLSLMARIVEATDNGVLVTDPDGHIGYVNPAFTAITGYGSDEVLGKTPALLRSGRHDQAFYAEMWRQLKALGHWQGEIWNRRKNGELFMEWTTISDVRNAGGERTHFVSLFSDVTRLKQSAQRMEYLAHHDVLTGLPNRLLINARLEHAIQLAQREKKSLAVMFIDLDHFKEVNDRAGHAAGDQLLQSIATRMRDVCRAGDTLGRLGGDEFLLLLEGGDDDASVHRVGAALLALFPLRVPAPGGEIAVTASIGLARYPRDGRDADALLNASDIAMYSAKQGGRNRLVSRS